MSRRNNIRSARPERCRRDGWSGERQATFLAELAETRSVTRAATAAGMSRESAYRLRERREGALFALLWDRVLQPDRRDIPESHSWPLSDGCLARMLGNQFRRERGDFASIGAARRVTLRADRTVRS